MTDIRVRVIQKPYRVVRAPNRRTDISICPFCGNRNYFIMIRKPSGVWTCSRDYSRCEHFVHTRVRKIGRYYRKVAVYTNPPFKIMTEEQKRHYYEVLAAEEE